MIHEQREVVKLEFHYNEELIKLVKSLPGARWSAIYRAWYIEKRAGLLNEVLSCFKGKAYLDYKAIKHEALLSAEPEPVKAESTVPGRLNKVQRARAKQYALLI
ncbi:MAG: hypothetical protein ACXVP0_04195 [Bacteroidia bacterium]